MNPCTISNCPQDHCGECKTHLETAHTSWFCSETCKAAYWPDNLKPAKASFSKQALEAMERINEAHAVVVISNEEEYGEKVSAATHRIRLPEPEELTNIKEYRAGSHMAGSRQHDTLEYRHAMRVDPDIILYWAYCPECHKVIKKQLIGFSSPNNMAYVRDLIKNGERVVESI